MLAIDTVEFLEEVFTSSVEDSTNKLYGNNISTDPYEPLEKKVPFLLIEPDDTDYDNTDQGHVTESQHKLQIFCVVSTNKKERKQYKREANELAHNTVIEINKIADHRFKFYPKKIEYQEIMIGSLKCSGALINLTVETLFNED